MEATRRLDRGNEGHGPRQQQRYQQHQSKWCFHCRRNNHNSAECRFLNSISPAKPSGSKVICYNCQEPGHTRPDCPKRNQPKKDLGERKESYNLKLPKSDKVERKVNFTTSQDKPKFVSGMFSWTVGQILQLSQTTTLLNQTSYCRSSTWYTRHSWSSHLQAEGKSGPDCRRNHSDQGGSSCPMLC